VQLLLELGVTGSFSQVVRAPSTHNCCQHGSCCSVWHEAVDVTTTFGQGALNFAEHGHLIDKVILRQPFPVSEMLLVCVMNQTRASVQCWVQHAPSVQAVSAAAAAAAAAA